MVLTECNLQRNQEISIHAMFNVAILTRVEYMLVLQMPVSDATLGSGIHVYLQRCEPSIVLPDKGSVPNRLLAMSTVTS